LIAHVDGSAPYVVTDFFRLKTSRALLDHGLVSFYQATGSRHPARRSTFITNDGRQVLACILAEYADALVAAGFGVDPPVDKPTLDTIARFVAAARSARVAAPPPLPDIVPTLPPHEVA
jgi:hypothetical protein